MKRVVSLTLLVLMVLASISFAACTGGGGAPPTGETTPPSSNGGTTPPPSGGDTTPPPSGGGIFTWNDMLVYPGASQVAKGSWMEPQQEKGELHKVEWQHYKTGDGKDKVFAFYRSGMPGKGWQQMMQMEMGELSWLIYTKNNEKDIAWVYVAEEDGQTLIHLMRGSE